VRPLTDPEAVERWRAVQERAADWRRGLLRK